jgi:hypothetical protein
MQVLLSIDLKGTGNAFLGQFGNGTSHRVLGV